MLAQLEDNRKTPLPEASRGSRLKAQVI